MIIRRIIFLLCCLPVLQLCAQSLPLRFQGNVSEDRVRMSGVNLQISKSGRVMNNILTDANGNYSFELPMGGEYMVTVSKEGYVSKKFSVSTMGVPPEKATSKFPIIEASLTLFKRMEGVDYSLLNQHLNKYYYNVDQDNFEYDENHLRQMLKGLEQIKEQEKALKNKDKEKEAAYLAAVKNGDKAYQKKEWQPAINAYNEALQIKPGEVYPGAQIAKIQSNLAEEAKAKQAAEAAKALAEKQAREKAEADVLAKKQADEAAAKKAAEAATAAALAKKAADEAAAKALADKQAKDKLEADSRKASVPSTVKTTSDKAVLPVLGAAQTNTNYTNAIKRADEAFSKHRYYDAKQAYEEALVAKSGDVYAKTRLMECEKHINADANQKVDERQKMLLAKYPPGVTEEMVTAESVLIIRRILVNDNKAFVYEKKVFNWGGIACFRDGEAITEMTFEQETRKEK